MPPTGDLARNPGMCPDWESNWWPFGAQASTQSTEPHQPGLEIVLTYFSSIPFITILTIYLYDHMIILIWSYPYMITYMLLVCLTGMETQWGQEPQASSLTMTSSAAPRAFLAYNLHPTHSVNDWMNQQLRLDARFNTSQHQMIPKLKNQKLGNTDRKREEVRWMPRIGRSNCPRHSWLNRHLDNRDMVTPQ